MSVHHLRARLLPLLVLVTALWAEEAAARQWYEHYQEGLALLERGEVAAALTAFEAAAELAPEPRARVRTYGTQFLFAYDPAYQRARCLTALGRLDEARALLAQAEAAGVTAPELLRALGERLVPPPQVSAEPPPETPPTSERPAEGPSEPTASPAPAPLDPAPASGGAEPVASPPPLPLPAPEEKPAVRSAPAGLGVTLPPKPVPTTAPSSPPSVSIADPPAAARIEPVASRGEEPRAGIPWPWAGGALLTGAGGVLAVLLLRRRRARRVADARGGSGWHARLLGARLGGYALLSELGRGGMATTFRARRLADGRTVALKVPHPSGDPHFEERFLREGRLGETLHHPGIVRILEAGAERGVAYLAMELVEGRTLKAEIEAHPEGLPLERALAIARSIAEALDYAHGKGVIHRDLKPENVMLATDGAVKVLDFGVARLEGQPGLTSSQFFLGSPLYAAPEAIEPQRIDHRADLYSLGILLFEMLTGKPPFVHESVFKLLELHREEPLPERASLPRSLPPEVWAVLSRLCAKRPEERFPSAEVLLVELGRLVDRPNGGQAR